MDPILAQNKNAWNIAAKHFYGGGVLPSWGALGEGSDNSQIIGNIENKTFLEIGCGSGHSVQYLLNNGAQKVYGIDISEQQISYATELNQRALSEGKVELFCSPMEERVAIESQSIDTVFSIYGIGWTQDLHKTLTHVYSYLKPGGMLVFSFENPAFTRSSVDKNTNLFSFTGSPYEDYNKTLDEWFGTTASVTCRLPSTWIRQCLQTGFTLVDYFDPRPVTVETEEVDLIDYYSKNRTDAIAPIFIMIFEK
jgi:SAM-dependent methyltransferase